MKTMRTNQHVQSQGALVPSLAQRQGFRQITHSKASAAKAPPKVTKKPTPIGNASKQLTQRSKYLTSHQSKPSIISNSNVPVMMFSPFSPRTPKMDITAKKPSLNTGTIKRMTDLKKNVAARLSEVHPVKHTLSV